MKTQKHTGKLVAIGLGILACFGLSSCDFFGTGGGDSGGLVVDILDTTVVNLTFTKSNPATGAWAFGANDSFNVANVRKKISDNGIDSTTVQITNVEATFDPATLAFVTANTNVPFYMKISTQTPLVGGGTADTIALETSKSPYLTFTTAVTAYKLNQNLLANKMGIGKFLKAIQDPAVKYQRLRGELDGDGLLQDSLKAPGPLNVNFIITVSGKLKP